MAIPTMEVQVLKSVYSAFLKRVVKQGELVEVYEFEAERWMGSYVSEPPVEDEEEQPRAVKKKRTKKKERVDGSVGESAGSVDTGEKVDNEG